jgi:hypothetical protein
VGVDAVGVVAIDAGGVVAIDEVGGPIEAPEGMAFAAASAAWIVAETWGWEPCIGCASATSPAAVDGVAAGGLAPLIQPASAGTIRSDPDIAAAAPVQSGGAGYAAGAAAPPSLL